MIEISDEILPRVLWSYSHQCLCKYPLFFVAAGTTREHLGLAIALRIPLVVVITKTDLSSPEALNNTVTQLERILKSPGCNKVPIIVEDQDDVATAASNFPSGQYVSLFHLIFSLYHVFSFFTN